jgi:hypothetical protein
MKQVETSRPLLIAALRELPFEKGVACRCQAL